MSKNAAMGWMKSLSKSCHHLVQAISPALGSGLGMVSCCAAVGPPAGEGVARGGCPDWPNPSQPLMMVPSPAQVLGP